MTNENTKKTAVKLLYDVYTLNLGINERITKLFEEMQKEEKQEEEKKEQKKKKPKPEDGEGKKGEDKNEEPDGDEMMDKVKEIMRAMSVGKGKEKTEETIKRMEEEAEKKEKESEESEKSSHPSDSEEEISEESSEDGMGSESGSGEMAEGGSGGEGSEEGDGEEINGEVVEVPYIDHTSSEPEMSSGEEKVKVDVDTKDKVYCGVCRKYHTKGTHD